MTTDDIAGIAACRTGKTSIDLVDRELWAWLESRHPGLRDDLLTHRAPGESVHIPHRLETDAGRAQRVDDGAMSVRELAEDAGVSYWVAWRVRRAQKSRV